MKAEPRPAALVFEALALTAAALGATLLVLRFAARLGDYQGAVIAAVWLYLPLVALRVFRLDPAELALGSPPVRQSLFFFALWTALTYPPFYLAWAWVQTHRFGLFFQPVWRPEFTALLLTQTLAIALPEEVFFRGYLQGRLNRVFGRPWKLWSAPIGPGLFLTAAIFVLCHLVIGVNWVRLAILFPALLFGWLRERTGSVLASVLFHAAANFSFLLAQAWFTSAPP